jgi:Rrf2 family transcriptional regulator, cysteine metabolism repressor
MAERRQSAEGDKQGCMVLSQKSEYAVRAVFELAKREGSGLVKATAIAAAQVVPVRFLENILGQLRQAGIIESVRGKEGGYRLGRPSRELTVGEVIRAVQGPMSAVDCADDVAERRCALRPGCVLLPMWVRAQKAMTDVYDATTFEDLVEQERAAHECEATNYSI